MSQRNDPVRRHGHLRDVAIMLFTLAQPGGWDQVSAWPVGNGHAEHAAHPGPDCQSGMQTKVSLIAARLRAQRSSG